LPAFSAVDITNPITERSIVNAQGWCKSRLFSTADLAAQLAENQHIDFSARNFLPALSHVFHRALSVRFAQRRTTLAS
jgi:hypothetical protein